MGDAVYKGKYMIRTDEADVGLQVARSIIDEHIADLEASMKHIERNAWNLTAEQHSKIAAITKAFADGLSD